MNENKDLNAQNIQWAFRPTISQKNGLYIEKQGSKEQLKFQGNYLNDIKDRKCKDFVNFKGGGDYNEQGMKHGKWIDVIDNYDQRLCPIIFSGEYNNGLRIGQWYIFENFEVVGGGIYNEHGKKEEFWTDIDENYLSLFNFTEIQFNLIHMGYYRNGYRIGDWKIKQKQNETIGGGFYQDFGLRNGKWIEIPQQNIKQNRTIIFTGEYKSGIRIGNWHYQSDEQILGGGYFNDKGQKHGKWIDVDGERDSFDPIIQSGEYKQDIKVGEWKSKLGQGQYDEKGQKQGYWIEIFWDLRRLVKFTFSGEYKNDKRIRKWTILQDSLEIGGGEYNSQGLKEGFWIDPDFTNIDNLFKGMYMNGFRIGEWKDTNHISNYNMKGMKVGEWIEQGDFSNITLKGKYEDGIKIGEWYIIDEQNVIGGGMYDDQGIKQGKWTEPHFLYKKYSRQLIYRGSYKNDVRIGKWELRLDDDIIGGGTYDDKGIMQGEWKEINEEFTNEFQIIDQSVYRNGHLMSRVTLYENNIIKSGKFNDQGLKEGHWIYNLKETTINYRQFLYLSGEYKNGKRVEKWIYTYKDKLIGGGNYDRNGKKVETWTELINNRIDLTESGLYFDEQRIGQWSIKFDNHQIGGGNYNQNGNKEGIWMDVSNEYQYSKQMTFKGEYKNGIRVGFWQTLFKKRQIGGGAYDLEGRKQGSWIDALGLTNWTKHHEQGIYKDGKRTKLWKVVDKGVTLSQLIYA